jgi:hypothetical protein
VCAADGDRPSLSTIQFISIDVYEVLVLIRPHLDCLPVGGWLAWRKDLHIYERSADLWISHTKPLIVILSCWRQYAAP